MKQRIVIREIDRPKKRKTKEEVKWICNSLGLMTGRDLENTSFKIMYELLDLFSDKKLVSTESVADSLNIEAPRINHHIRTMMESGILLREKRKIVLRGGSLSGAIEEMKRDSNEMFNRLLEVSKKIDENFEL